MVHAIILAGGSGTRLSDAKLPKQFIKIDGVTLLERVVDVFFTHELINTITIVVPSDYIDLTKKLFAQHQKHISIISGGASRQESSKLGLLHLQSFAMDDDIVLIHDAARILVDQSIITRGISMMSQFKAATAAVEVKDSLRKILHDGKLGEVIDRKTTIILQTPQVFRYQTILSAHLNPITKEATDDISLVMDSGNIGYFLGSELNFKVTTANDLSMLKAILNQGPIHANT